MKRFQIFYFLFSIFYFLFFDLDFGPRGGVSGHVGCKMLNPKSQIANSK